MDISIAKQKISVALAASQDNCDVLKLASDILNDKFKAEFIAIEQVKEELADTLATLSTTKAEKADLQTTVAQLTTEKETIVNELTSEKEKTAILEQDKETLTIQKLALESEKQSALDQIAILTAKVDEVSKPVDEQPLPPIADEVSLPAEDTTI